VEPIEEVTTLSQLDRIPQPLGPRITVARENAGMSVEELATRLGVTRASVAAWEADERTPRANRLLMLSGVLNVSLTWLLEGRENRRMEGSGGESLDEVASRIEAARTLLAEGLALIESAQASLAALAADEEDVDPSEVED